MIKITPEAFNKIMIIVLIINSSINIKFYYLSRCEYIFIISYTFNKSNSYSFQFIKHNAFHHALYVRRK